MLCFAGNRGIVSIKTDDFPVQTQRSQGFVVGFRGSRVFCLQGVNMQTVDVPQAPNLYRYLEKKDFTKAYKIACLGMEFILRDCVYY